MLLIMGILVLYFQHKLIGLIVIMLFLVVPPASPTVTRGRLLIYTLAHTGNFFRFDVRLTDNTSSNLVEIVTLISVNQDHILGCSYNATTKLLCVYVDGILVDSDTLTASPELFTETPIIGRHWYGGSLRDSLDGTIQYINGYKGCLSATDHKKIADRMRTQGSTINATPDFFQCRPTSWSDITANGGLAFGTGTPTVNPAGYIDFDGTNAISYGTKDFDAKTIIIDFDCPARTASSSIEFLASVDDSDYGVIGFGNISSRMVNETFYIGSGAGANVYYSYIKQNLPPGRKIGCFVWDGSTYQIFIIGEKQVLYAGSQGAYPLVENCKITLGTKNDGNMPNAFVGKVYNFAVWRDSYSLTEIAGYCQRLRLGNLRT